MNDATPPPIVTPKKFTLSTPVKIVWLGILGLTLYLAISVHHLDSRSLGELTGRFIAHSLFSLLFSWIAWRLSSRSNWVKSAVFLIVFLLFSSDALAGLGRRRSAPPAALAQVQEQARLAQKAQIDEFKETGTISRNTQAMDQVIATMRNGASQGNDLERKLMAGMADFMQRIRDAEAKHSDTSEQMNSEWILQPKTQKTPAELETLAGSVTNFLQANEKFSALFTDSAAHITQELQAKGVPSKAIDGAVQGFQSGFNPQVPFVKKLRAQDAEFGHALLELLELYKADHGKWKWDDQNELATFESESSNQRWLALLEKINQTASEQQQTQADLIDLRSRTLARPKK